MEGEDYSKCMAPMKPKRCRDQQYLTSEEIQSMFDLFGRVSKDLKRESEKAPAVIIHYGKNGRRVIEIADDPKK